MFDASICTMDQSPTDCSDPGPSWTVDDSASSLEERSRYLAQLFDDHYRAVRSYLSRFLRNEDDIADTTQDVFVRVAQLVDPFKTELNPRAYLFSVAQHLVVDRIRRETVRRVAMHTPLDDLDIDSGAPSVESQVNWRMAISRITHGLNAAGARVVSVVEMSCLQDYTHAEIAEQLDVSTRTVERCMRDARRVCEPFLASI